MKKITVVLTIVCALSFIAFGLSYAILGRRYNDADVVYLSGEKSIFGELVTSSSSWEIVNEFPNININAAGAKTVIQQNDGDRILVSAEVPDGREVYVGASYDESLGELTIEARPKNVTFSDLAEEFGKVLWSDDVFNFPEGVTVTISFPQTIYESLDIKLGSGKMYVDELYACFTGVDIGSGTFEMQRSKDYEADWFELDLGSGKANVKNMRASSFNIDVGSGSFNITGLSGSGVLDMGSGVGTLVLGKECESLEADIGSGSLDIYLEETGASIFTDIGSGSVNVDAYGTKVKLGMNDDDLSVTVGSGAAGININMGSGSVDILEAANAPALELSIPESEGSGAAVILGTASSSLSEQCLPIVTETEIAEVSESPEAPTAPENITEAA